MTDYQTPSASACTLWRVGCLRERPSFRWLLVIIFVRNGRMAMPVDAKISASLVHHVQRLTAEFTLRNMQRAKEEVNVLFQT